ncbi:uncharacterized protein ACOB8E_021290 isoform 1-T3 [Sarcophilus harrisii]
MAPGRAPNCADWRLTRAASSCRAGSQLPQGKAPYCGLGLRACAEIYAFTFGLRLSSEPNFSPSLRCSLPWPRNQPFFWRDCRFSSAVERRRGGEEETRGNMTGSIWGPGDSPYFYMFHADPLNWFQMSFEGCSSYLLPWKPHIRRNS